MKTETMVHTMSDQTSQGHPDPNCKECRGTGVITLFTSSRACDCINSKLVSFHDWKEIRKSLRPRDFMEEFLLEPEI